MYAIYYFKKQKLGKYQPSTIKNQIVIRFLLTTFTNRKLQLLLFPSIILTDLFYHRDILLTEKHDKNLHAKKIKFTVVVSSKLSLSDHFSFFD